MKKYSLLLFLFLSVFAFSGCGDDDKFKDDNGSIDNGGTGDKDDDDDTKKEYVLSLPVYETHKLDLGDTENPIDNWSTSFDYEGVTYTTHYFHTLLTDKNKLFEFDCVSSDAYGFSSDGFAFTNCTVTDCPDFASYDYRAIPKKGVTNNTYVIAGAAGYKIGLHSDKEVSIRFKNNDNFNETKDYRVKGMYVTNCVFVYKSMTEGSTIFSGLDKFGKDDSFKLIIYNPTKTKKVECYLAEGTNILTTWKWIDLTSLGETNGLKFELTTTRTDENGAMTPTYFCLDAITLIDK
ncbi:DUF4465 domain-containing protein [Bacteroides sp.]|uniref:DUF4465 domain-containing protein n=1 Tax=Bacteroides sp. TaxID=29523 RepID=UPI00262CFD40|nr:DUF4465 domain-containing protein [Bacteroides sp.]MDD3037864.1 DUF4465 domain-containing protein [Bacteroides sp.]